MVFTRSVSATISALQRGEKVHKPGLYQALNRADNAFQKKLLEAIIALEEKHEAEERLYQAKLDAMTWDEFIGDKNV